jgi:hypothetical protein
LSGEIEAHARQIVATTDGDEPVVAAHVVEVVARAPRNQQREKENGRTALHARHVNTPRKRHHQVDSSNAPEPGDIVEGR